MAKSVHVVIKNTYISVALITNSHNDFYSEHSFVNPLKLDGYTENTAEMSISGNTLTLKVNNETFTDTFSGLSVFNGRYAIFEFFCLGNRNVIAMPQYTYMQLTDNNDVSFDDDFHRPDGQLTVTPTGKSYSLFT